MVFYTIGVYGSTKDSFFKQLTDNSIDTFIDIRLRRGVRGSQYAYVNSTQLQSELDALGINYLHYKGLAPTQEIRAKQKQDDECKGVKKRDRYCLSETFTRLYKEDILANFDFQRYIHELETYGANHAVLFCVEEMPTACHRSLVAEKLASIGYEVVNL